MLLETYFRKTHVSHERTVSLLREVSRFIPKLFVIADLFEDLPVGNAHVGVVRHLQQNPFINYLLQRRGFCLLSAPLCFVELIAVQNLRLLS